MVDLFQLFELHSLKLNYRALETDIQQENVETRKLLSQINHKTFAAMFSQVCWSVATLALFRSVKRREEMEPGSIFLSPSQA